MKMLFPTPWPATGLFFLVIHGLLTMVAPQGLYQLLGTNGLTEFQRILNTSFAVKGVLDNLHLELTLFAPSNEAIARWKATNRQNIINSDILQNHIAPGAWNSVRLLEVAGAAANQDRRLLSGFQSSPLWLRSFPASSTRSKAKVYVNDALITSEQPFQSGVHILYIIDDVLAPTGSFVTAKTFLEDPASQMHSELALVELQHEVEQMAHFTALEDTSSVFTFLLPSDVAFSTLKTRGSFDAAVLKGHVIADEVVFLRTAQDALSDMADKKPIPGFPSLLNGGGPSFDTFLGFSNSSTQQQVYSLIVKPDSRYPNGRVYGNIIKANIPVKNGVVHIIDRILLLVEQNAKEILESRRDLFKFRELFNFADPKLLERLSSDVDLTVFVPSNAALEALPRDKSGRLRQDRHLTDRILNLHLIPRRLRSHEITNVTTVLSTIAQRLTFQVQPTDNAETKSISVEGNGVSARIVEPDVASTNAVIHVIDQVLGIQFMNALEKLRGEPSLSRTYKAFEQTRDLNSVLSSTTTNYTVFAPSNQAWLKLDSSDRNTILSQPKLLARILKRHLVEGRRMETTSLRKEDRYTATPSDVLIKQTLGTKDTLLTWKGHSAKITTYDIGAVNGVIHVIDHVLFDREIDLASSSSSSSSVVFASLYLVIVVSLFSFI